MCGGTSFGKFVVLIIKNTVVAIQACISCTTNGEHIYLKFMYGTDYTNLISEIVCMLFPGVKAIQNLQCPSSSQG